MSRRLGLEIVGDEYRVAVVQPGVGGPRLRRLERVSIANPAALAELLRGATEVRCGLPLGRVTHRFVQVPFRRATQIAAVVPLELLSQLPHEPDDGVIGTCTLARTTSGANVLAALTRRRTLDALVAHAPPAARTPWTIDLAGPTILAVLPRHYENATIVVAEGAASYLCAQRGGQLTALRALDDSADTPQAFVASAAFAVRVLAPDADFLLMAGSDTSPALIDQLSAAVGVPVTALHTAATALGAFPADTVNACAGAAGLALGGRRTRLTFPAVAATAAPTWPRRVAGLAIAATLLAGVDLGLYHHRLTTEDHALQDAIRSAAATVLTADRARSAPQPQLEAMLLQQRGRSGPSGTPALELLRDTSTRLPNDLPLQVDDLQLDDEHFRLHGFTDSYEHVDALRRALGASPFLANAETTDTRGSVDGHHIEFTLQATRRRPAGTAS